MQRVVYILLPLVLVVAGCGGTEPPVTTTPPSLLTESTPVLTPAITFTPEQPAPTTTPEPATPEAATPTTAPASNEISGGESGQIWSLVDVRYGVNESRVRIVWEMAEAGTEPPRYTVQQVETDAGQRIEVVLIDVYAYDYPLNEVLPIEPAESARVTRIEQLPTYDDAALGFALHVVPPAEYEAFALTDPVRVVVDVVE